MDVADLQPFLRASSHHFAGGDRIDRVAAQAQTIQGRTLQE